MKILLTALCRAIIKKSRNRGFFILDKFFFEKQLYIAHFPSLVIDDVEHFGKIRAVFEEVHAASRYDGSGVVDFIKTHLHKLRYVMSKPRKVGSAAA